MHRRHFLQFATATLVSLGLSPRHLQQQGRRYGQALAQPAQRKRALLVGINNYNPPLQKLKGCVLDTELQRELLIHRFGFPANDILVLQDQDATRQNILAAFENHLIDACQAGDVAVFHFSGHGRRIADPTPTRVGEERDPLNSTLVPYQAADDADEDDLPDIMGKTLFLLTSRLQTENVTVVLDSCYAEGGIRGNIRVRSGGNRPSLQPSQTELDYQASLREKLGLDEAELQALRDISIAKGIALAAARRDQEAADVTFERTASGDRFSVGAFTYFLTQYLWQEAEPIYRVIANVSRNLADDTFSQKPSACVAPLECTPEEPGTSPTPTYFVDPLETEALPTAEGVVRSSVSNRQGTLWLGGSDRHSLATYGTGATFTAIAPDGTPLPNKIIVRSRQGLTANVLVEGTLPPGTLVQESSRIIPADYKLRVGIDPSVMGELDAIQNAFGAIPRLELVPYQSDEILYDGEIHYILSRATAAYLAYVASVQSRQLISEDGTVLEGKLPPQDSLTVLESKLPPQDSLTVFSQGLDEILPGSWGEAGEAIEEAKERLAIKFNALIAARLVKLLINANSSRLNISAEMQVVGGGSQQARFFTVRGSRGTRSATPGGLLEGGLLEVPVGRSLQFVVTHQEPEPLYLLLLILDRTGEIFPVFPRQLLGATANDILIPPNQRKLIPDPSTPLEVSEPGFGEALIIASRSPLIQALQALRSDRTATTRVVDALMGDLSDWDGSKQNPKNRGFEIATARMTGMSIPFRAVPS